MMKRRMLNRTGTWLMLVVFVFTSALSMAVMETKANADGEISITDYDTTPGTIEPGKEFDLKLDLKASDNISDLKIDFSQNSNLIIKQGMVVTPDTDSISSGETISLPPIPMTYVGSESILKMNIIFNYKVGGSPETSSNIITIAVDRDDDGGSGTPFDPNKHVPTLQATVNYNTVTAGSSNKVKINIKNVSSTGAKNITYIPVVETDSPFILSKATTSMPINYLQSGKSVDMDLSIDVDKLSPEGVYPFIFKLSYSNSWNVEQTKDFVVYLKVVNHETNARLNVYLPSESPVSATAGGTFNVLLRIFNEGTLYAKDVRVTLANLSQDTFTLSSGTGRYEFSRIGGRLNQEISYTLIASSKLASGSYPLTVKLEYSDERGNKVTEEQQVWIPVSGNEAKVSMLEILEIKPSVTNVKPGESFDVSVKIRNSGEFDVPQIKVSADGSGTLLPVTQNLVIIPKLAKGETRTINFKFQPMPDAQRGGVPITIKVESIDGGQDNAISQAISVFVDASADGGDEAGKNVPKIIIKSYYSEPTLVKAGENFVLNMQFMNTHATKTVRNIKGNFTVTESSTETGNVFTPVNSSNTFYIDEIEPKGTCDWVVTLYTIPDAKSKTYTVNINFEYEDDSGNTPKSEEIIGIPVYQPSRFEVSEISLPSQVMMGEPLYVPLEMYNMGKTDIYNVRLTVEGDFQADPKSSYFGNFESGRTEYFEFNLIPMMPGQNNGRIIFQYENSSGELQEVVKEISVNVMEMMMPPEGEFPVDGKPMPGMEEPQPQKGFIGSVWFYIIIGVVVVGVVVAIILIRRKRKKDKEFDF